MTPRQKTSRGQALVLVTVSLLAMSGLLGLAVDMGWMFYVKKQAQSAADSAAMAAVIEAKARMGGSFSGFTCPGSPTVSTPWCNTSATLECSGGNASVGSTSNLYNGCLYAARNGFSHSANASQWVKIQASDPTTAPPGMTLCTGAGTPAPCYDPTGLAYWVSVTTIQTVPQLFSSILGNTNGTVTATATAGVISSVVPGQFIALNQSGSWIQGKNKPIQGEDVDLQGNGSLTVPGGILLASNCTSSSQSGCSGVGTETGGSSSLCSGSGCPGTGNGTIEISVAGAAAGASVSPAAVVGGGPFTDPYQGVPQPPLIPANSTVGGCAIRGGTITGGTGSNYVILGPRQYYSVNSNTLLPDGNPITLTGNIAFDPNASGCGGGISSGAAATGAFSTFYFYGGLNVNGATYFGPGEYAIVGANSSNAGAGVLLTMGASNITGSGTGAATGVNSPATVPSGVTADTGAGTLFVMTNPSYSAGLGVSSAPPSVATQVGNLGTFSMQAGNNSSISLAGLDRGVSSVPASLQQYNGLLIWQDRADSTVTYNANGYVTSSPTCTSVTNCNPNAPTPSTLNAETIQFQAHPNLSLAGVIYQPQGASLNMQGNGGITAALQLITGGFVSTGGGSVSLTSVQNPALIYIVALVH